MIDGPGLFLTKDSEIESVMFLASRTAPMSPLESNPSIDENLP